MLLIDYLLEMPEVLCGRIFRFSAAFGKGFGVLGKFWWR
ncbi:hypothetical protein C900_00854 [Fulvivirga imtechensis AK7]|uniref:Uncharacterized protein n=1 Tax=Fulvivirga imtechensis AK7 TaxID=1237149 RepID=L8JXI3_9BACT|nr:hypothetical protein C900_00854 [Fulvivirga imtechensis AK7]